MFANGKRLLICGNSVPVTAKDGKLADCFPFLLSESGYVVYNYCKVGGQINQLPLYLDDALFTAVPDYVILNFGVVEIYPRLYTEVMFNVSSHPHHQNQYVSFKYPRFSPGLLIYRIFKKSMGLYIRVSKRIQKYIPLFFQFTGIRAFKYALKNTLSHIMRYSDATIIIVLMPDFDCSGHGYWHRRLSEKIKSLNTQMMCVAEGVDNVEIIDPNDFIQADDVAFDRIHYTKCGMEKLKRSIIKTLK